MEIALGQAFRITVDSSWRNTGLTGHIEATGLDRLRRELAARIAARHVNPALAKLTNGTLLVLVRSLELAHRRAIALSVIYGFPEKHVAALMRLAPHEIDHLRATGLEQLEPRGRGW